MLRTFLSPLALLLVVMVVPTLAQQPDAEPGRDRAFQSPTGQVAASGMVAPTVEMWFYEQEQQRRDDTKLAIRRRAEARAQQRQDRLAAMRWYGISNSRPTVSPTPTCNGYSAHWGSNSFNPMRWRPVAPTVVVTRPTDGPY